MGLPIRSFEESVLMKTDVTTATISESLEVLVFDCDGVLFDSRKANTRFYSHILEHLGKPPVRPDQEEYIHMHPVRESLQYLLQSPDLFREAWDYLKGFNFSSFNKYLSKEPGLQELLELARISKRIALATNRTVSTRELLVHFELDVFFDLVVCASDVTHPKPHPEIMEKILDTFRVPPDKVLFIGDSPVDEELASATGVFFAAYKNPRLKAHLHLSHFDELQPIIANGKAGSR